MKKYRSLLCIGAVLLLLFMSVSGYTFLKSRTRISEGFLASEGNAAENFAVLTAANIHLTDAQVARLKACSYAELMASEENAALREMMSNDSFSSKVDYAYVMIHLKNDEVRYAVTEENRHRYDAPVGTKLDIMWLLDVNVSDAAAQLESSDLSDELERYSYYIEDDALIFGEAPTYLYNSSEWGDHICGYAPLYTTEGSYIGVIGVELRTVDYIGYCDQAVYAMGALLAVSLATLSLLFVWIYFRYKKLQFDRIYLDSLTQVYNRSYYNNRFIRRLNTHRAGPLFALMIADVDWFKKVNDHFGHDAGDEVLVELGRILVDTFGKDHVVRFGGEEFVIGAWFADEAALTGALDLLYRRIAEHRFSAREIELSISLGCSHTCAENLSGWLLSGMLRCADCKLYEVKEHGRKHYLIEAYDDKKEYRKAFEPPAKP